MQVDHRFVLTNDLVMHIDGGGLRPLIVRSMAACAPVLGDGFHQQRFHAPGRRGAELKVRRHDRRRNALVALSAGLLLALLGGYSLGAQSPTSARGNSPGPTINNEQVPLGVTSAQERHAPGASRRPRGASRVGAGPQPPDTTGFKFLVRGFVNTRIDHDQHNMGGSEPLFPPPVPLRSTLRFSANQTQLGFGVEAPPSGGLKNRGYFEIDFLGGAVEGEDRVFNRSPRMRQAYWWLGWNQERDALVVGQYYVLYADLLAPLPYDNLALTIGALTSREPQVRYMHVKPLTDSSALTFGVSVNAPNSGLYAENTGTAERSELPSVHAKLAYTYAGWGGVSYFGFEDLQPIPFVIALSGFAGAEMAERVSGDSSRIGAEGVAVNAVIPIVGLRENKRRTGAVGLIAQGWIGRNIDAYFGGNGQGIYETNDGRVKGITARGFFAGGNVFVSQNVWLGAFYSYEKNDLSDLVNAGIPFRITSGLFSGPTFGKPGLGQGRDINVTLWFNLLTSLYTGATWDYRQANYNDGNNGTNNRISLSLFYNFCSGAAGHPPPLPWVCRIGSQARDAGNPATP